ncbi:hypothetical protein TNCV_3600691 [Trichonephila clavipes]|nr:hypothetical protein TNCV_3600691 [Trichonephila clavipes]
MELLKVIAEEQKKKTEIFEDIGIAYSILSTITKTRERRRRGALPWMEKKKKPCPGSREHERRALVGTDWKRALAGGNLRRSAKEVGVERKERR